MKDLSFDEWFDIFIDECKGFGYNGPIDKYTFESDYDNDISPESCARSFIKEMNE